MNAAHSPRTVIVTGGGTGIGRAIAQIFAREEGDNVIIMGRRAEKLQEVAQALSADYQMCDVSDRVQVVSAVEAVTAKYGTIDVLINNAGVYRVITTETPLEEAERLWDEDINTNLKGCFLMCMACAPHLRRPGGRIINISSVNAYTGGTNPGAMGYTASKTGVHGLTYSLARELGPQGITVNVIVPNYTQDTEMTAGWNEARIKRITSETPLRRPGHVDDIAKAARFLASDEADYITGELMNVCGGRFVGR